MPVDHLIKTKREYINLKNQEIQDIFNGNFKELPRRLDSAKVLHNKASDIAKNPKYGGRFASMIYTFFDEISGTFGKTGISFDNQQLAKELHKSIFRNLKNIKYLFPAAATLGLLIWQICN